MPEAQVLWRRLDCPGHEAALLLRIDDGWSLQGAAVFMSAEGPCSLHYEIACDARWITNSASVWGWIGQRHVQLEIEADDARRWWLNGSELESLRGCFDIDLNFSPSTNLLPIRRMDLQVGSAADVRAAWLRFPDLQFEILEQRYQRLSSNRYGYSSNGGEFVSELEVDEAGFVIDYLGLWSQVLTL